MPYTPTWNNPYLPQGSVTLPYQMPQAVQPYQHPQYQQQQGTMRVDGPAEAMSRFLMRYPENMLVSGFSTDPIFDVNGRQFYVLSIEQDGRRNLETFDFMPHAEAQQVVINGVTFESKEAADDFIAKVGVALEALNGVHGSVPSRIPTTAGPTAQHQVATVPAAVADAGGHVGGGLEPSPEQPAVRPVPTAEQR